MRLARHWSGPSRLVFWKPGARALPLMQFTTGIENSRGLRITLQRKQKTGPTDSNSVCLSSDASRARRRVGVLWGFGRNPGCRASGDHHIAEFVIDVTSCFWLDGARTPDLATTGGGLSLAATSSTLLPWADSRSA